MSNAPKIDPRQIEYLPLTDLTPDPRNPKAHDDDVIDASIGRFGILDLIVQDQRTGYIVSGHGRHGVLSQMQERGESAPEGVKLDKDGRWLVPVVTGWSSRTDTEAAAALIALNRTTELGGWVDDNLLDLLDDLEDHDGDLVGVGYSEKQIEDLRTMLSEPPSLDTLADEWEDRGDANPEGKSASATSARLSLTVSTGTADVWEYHRAAFDDDDAALSALLSTIDLPESLAGDA